jgi:hypothetical protein
MQGFADQLELKRGPLSSGYDLVVQGAEAVHGLDPRGARAFAERRAEKVAALLADSDVAPRVGHVRKPRSVQQGSDESRIGKQADRGFVGQFLVPLGNGSGADCGVDKPSELDGGLQGLRYEDTCPFRASESQNRRF